MTPKFTFAAGAVAASSVLLAAVPEAGEGASQVVIALIHEGAGILTALALVITAVAGVLNYRQAKQMAVKVDDAAVKVAEVKTAADAAAVRAEEARVQTADAAKRVEEVAQQNAAQTTNSLAAISATGEKTHILVNSNMGRQLQISAAALRRVAEFTKDPADEVIAREAEKLLKEHESKQARVDRRE
jgi:hypothetical protein